MSSRNSAAAGKPDIDPSYANGKTVYMIGSHMIVNARETMPNAYEKAEELYLVVYPQETLPAPGAGQITLPSGYKPQCDPCFHPGLPPQFVYHDHVLTGAPGMGNSGTAGEFKAPWKIIVLVYNPAFVASKSFKPARARPTSTPPRRRATCSCRSTRSGPTITRSIRATCSSARSYRLTPEGETDRRRS